MGEKREKVEGRREIMGRKPEIWLLGKINGRWRSLAPGVKRF